MFLGQIFKLMLNYSFQTRSHSWNKLIHATGALKWAEGEEKSFICLKRSCLLYIFVLDVANKQSMSRYIPAVNVLKFVVVAVN